MKLCITCIHSRGTGGMIACRAPGNTVISPVDGLPKGRFTPDFLRDEGRYCGPDGGWYKPRAAVDAQARSAGI